MLPLLLLDPIYFRVPSIPVQDQRGSFRCATMILITSQWVNNWHCKYYTNQQFCLTLSSDKALEYVYLTTVLLQNVQKICTLRSKAS